MAEQRMLQECSLLLYCDCQSQDQFLGRGLLLSVFPFLHFFLLSCLYPHFFFFTVSLDSSSELSAGGFMTCCLTCFFFFCLSLCLSVFLLRSCHYSPLYSFQRTRCSCKASVWCSVCFCCLASPSSHWSWPPFALKLCCSVFPARLDIVVVVVCKLWQSALSQCTIFVWTRCTS